MLRPLTKSQIVEQLSATSKLQKREIRKVLDDLTALAYREARRGFKLADLDIIIVRNRKTRVRHV